jgi:hypothetical protein
MQKYGKHLDLPAKKRMEDEILRLPQEKAVIWLVTIRFLELLHTQQETWRPYKELCLPNRIQSLITMTSDELRNRILTFPKDEINEGSFIAWESEREYLQESSLPKTLEVLMQLLSFILPTAEKVHTAELIWAYTVVDTRSVKSKGVVCLAPLFDMMNHCPHRACSCLFLHGDPRRLSQTIAKLNRQAGKNDLRVVAGPGPGGAGAILTRRGRALGRLDECLLLQAGTGGLPAGAEARYMYVDIARYSPQTTMEFALDYGFFPADAAAPRGGEDGGAPRRPRRAGPVFAIDDGGR